MVSTAVSFKPVSHDGMICEVRSPQGRLLRLSGVLSDVEPEAEGDDVMIANRALSNNAWAYAKHEKQYRRLKNQDKRVSHRKQADAHAKTAEKMPDHAPPLQIKIRTPWLHPSDHSCRRAVPDSLGTALFGGPGAADEPE